MPTKDDLSDDAVARILANEAKKSSSRYSLDGLQAFLPKRPTTNAPKPNTRFLKNIIKETDSHNAALRDKEAQESRARLKKLSRQGQSDIANAESDDGRNSHRSKRRKVEDGRDSADDRYRGGRRVKDTERSSKDSQHQRRRDYGDQDSGLESQDSSRTRHRKHHYEDGDSRKRHRRRRSTDRSDRDERHSYHKHRRRSLSPHHHDRDISRERSSHHRHHHRHGRRDRSRSGERRTSEAAAESNGIEKKTRSERATSRERFENFGNTRKRKDYTASDSDPLESMGIIGPRPPSPPPKVISKGRGAFASKGSTAMDGHFKASYDPSVDVGSGDIDAAADEDDWAQALEAHRDRQRWKQQGADRLRQAGFSEKDIDTWQKGKGGVGLGGEGREEDVRWKGKGEGREWDRGKVVRLDEYDGDSMDGEDQVGRLKGT